MPFGCLKIGYPGITEDNIFPSLITVLRYATFLDKPKHITLLMKYLISHSFAQLEPIISHYLKLVKYPIMFICIYVCIYVYPNMNINI